MLKLLNKTINNVNAQHRKKGLCNYKILIEDKNKYADQLIEEDKRKKERKLYSNSLNSNLPPHKVGYTPRKINKIFFFFILYLSYLNMIEKQINKHSIKISNAKNEKLREKLKNILPLIIENENKKSKDFEEAVKKFKNDENYEFNYPLIERQFWFKALQELDEKLPKNKKGF